MKNRLYIDIDDPRIKWTITPEDDDIDPRSDYAVPGITSRDSEEADNFVAAVEEMVEEHGLWGWCSVKVEACLGPLVGEAYLDGCSYKDEDDFRRGGYYDQMRCEAVNDLEQQMENTLKAVKVEALMAEIERRKA